MKGFLLGMMIAVAVVGAAWVFTAKLMEERTGELSGRLDECKVELEEKRLGWHPAHITPHTKEACEKYACVKCPEVTFPDCEYTCSELIAARDRAHRERLRWKELAENCVAEKLEVKDR